MKDYLMLFVFPSRALDKLNERKPDHITLFLIWSFVVLGLIVPSYLASAVNNPKGAEALILPLIIIPFLYFPLVYGLGYCYWIVAKGFKGVSSFGEMKNLVVLSIFPFILQLIISIPFVAVGLIKNDARIISHDNYLTGLIFSFLSLRILMVGIAKYNQFNWSITIITWIIATLPITGLVLLRIWLK